VTSVRCRRCSTSISLLPIEVTPPDPQAESPWHRDPYIRAAITFTLLVLVAFTIYLVRDGRQTHLRHELRTLLTNGDRLLASGQYQAAIKTYQRVESQGSSYDDPEVKESVRLAGLACAQAVHGEEVEAARQAEAARQQEVEAAQKVTQQREAEAEPAPQKVTEAARQEQTEVSHRQAEQRDAEAEKEAEPLLVKARESEATEPGIAARYYRDVAKKYPSTSIARKADTSARACWKRAYGDLPYEESVGVTNSSSSGGGSVGSTATGLPLYVGPRGGIYHYSKSGKKVYQRKK
jgi:hypothetical protein